MNNWNNHEREPRALSPTPLRDYVACQLPARRAGLVGLFAILIACGSLASFNLPYTPVTGSHQLLFVLLSGALLGSRLGSVAAIVYLIGAAATGLGWPAGAGETPLTGPAAGTLWSLPLAAFASGATVERANSEEPVHFTFGAAVAVGIYTLAGVVRLMGAQDLGPAEAYVKGAGLFLGQHIMIGALAVLIGHSASTAVRAREGK